MLIQHSLFNCRYNPFLLCTCNRGKGVKNENHVCRIIKHDDQIRYWDRSKKIRLDKKKHLLQGEKYEYFDHIDWIDCNNHGVLHFGLHPSLLPRDNIRFDVLHL